MCALPMRTPPEQLIGGVQADKSACKGAISLKQ
jgi:hypothetical protein